MKQNAEPMDTGHRVCKHCGSPEAIVTFGRRLVDWTLEQYMVKDATWPIEKRGYLHLKCLEVVLGRKLTIEDFPTLPINSSILFGYRMGRDHEVC